MDPRIAEAFGALSNKLTKLFTDGIFTVTKPYSHGWSDTFTVNNLAALQRRGWLDMVQQIGGPARFIRITTNVNCTLHITKAIDVIKEIRISDIIVAGIEVVIEDEEVTRVRFEPVAYPLTVNYYISR